MDNQDQSQFNQQPAQQNQNIAPANMPPASQSKKSKIVLIIALATLLVIANVAAWLWNSKNSESNDTQQTTTQNNVDTTTESTEQDEVVPGESTNPVVELEGNTGQIVTSQIRKENNNIYFDYYVGAGFSEVWVEYGTDQENLTEKTDPETGELGMISSDEFGGGSAVIPETDLPSNEDALYFYRAAGTYDGKTVYGGVVVFNHK